MQFKLFLLLVGMVVLAGCADSKEKSPEIIGQMVTASPATLPDADDAKPPWSDQELLLKCEIQWNGKKTLSVRYDPEQNRWHSKRILSFSYFRINETLTDDRHWISRGSRQDSRIYLHSSSLNPELDPIPIEIEQHSLDFHIHTSVEKPDLYLIEQLCGKCPSAFSWLDINNCHADSCQLQPLDSVGFASPKNMSQGYWSPDFSYLFLYESLEQGRSYRHILTDHDGAELYDFGNDVKDPIWLDSSTFGFWSNPDKQENAVFRYGSVSDGKTDTLFTESDLFSLLPILSEQTPSLRNFNGVKLSSTSGESRIVLFFLLYYDRPQFRDERNQQWERGGYSAIVSYNLRRDTFDVLWQSYGQYDEQLSPDRTMIYVSSGFSPIDNTTWQIIDILSGEISTANWIPFNPSRRWFAESDLSYDGEWRVVFLDFPKDSVQEDSNQMILVHKSGYREIIDFPEDITNCYGGWIFK